MSRYAKVLNGKVVDVIVADAEFIATLTSHVQGEKWIQTSFNTRGGIHYGEDGQPDGGVALRMNYAMIGGNYDEQADAFYENPLYPDMILNTTTYTWEYPVPYPTDGNAYEWDSNNHNWVLKTLQQTN
jgi:hypothetical protein